jgi:predicted RNA-binding protein with PIN domain
VQFSSAGTIADDLIRSLVSTLPAEQKVVVVTSDKDLVASVRAMGANTISSQQFIAALGR